VKLDVGPEVISRCIREAGVGFMFAQMHHSAMRHVGPSRVELGTRTIFNLLGPLSNPAGVRRQLLGVFAPQWLMPIAEVMRDLGSESVWVVHGDGLDEITTTGKTSIAALEDGKIRTFELSPADFGITPCVLADIKGGDGTVNAAALREVLSGAKNAYRDIALANAAASLVIAGKAETIRDGMRLAKESLDSGATALALDKLIAVSNDID
jgi:anthranilate phosphoribosyltransferase